MMDDKERSAHAREVIRAHAQARRLLCNRGPVGRSMINREICYAIDGHEMFVIEVRDSIIVWTVEATQDNLIYVDRVYVSTYLADHATFNERMMRADVGKWWDHDAFLSYLSSMAERASTN